MIKIKLLDGFIPTDEIALEICNYSHPTLLQRVIRL